MSAKLGARILGPYEQQEPTKGWRVIVVEADGHRTYRLFATEAKAQRYIEKTSVSLFQSARTTDSALDEYKAHLEAKGTQEQSRDVTEWAVKQFFPDPLPLHSLTAKRCAALYEELRTRPSKATKKPLAADTHRNVLAQTKSFLAWCVQQHWLRENPLADVHGIGKRRPRGKSLGKDGSTLRVREARAWYKKALDLADGGDEGAVAALVALLLGLRASEIVSRRVGDVDEDEAVGDLLWIPCSKTPAGRRTLEVPAELRGPLLVCCEGKASERYIFEADDGLPHWRDWVLANVHRICDLAKVPRITAHALRGLNATIAADRGLNGHLIAAHLGHEDERTTKHSYAEPGSFAAGERKRSLAVLNGRVQVSGKSAK